MGFRNHIGRMVLLSLLVLGVGIAVALGSGSDRGPMVQGRALPLTERPAEQRIARPALPLEPRPSCPLREGCARL